MELEQRPEIAKRKKRKRRKLRGESAEQWEELRESGVVGIDSLPGGGIVSAPVISGKALPRIGRRMSAIKRRAKISERDGDGDGFRTNPLTGRDDLPVLPNVPGMDAISGAIRSGNNTEYIGDEGLIKAQARQVSEFEKWSKGKQWNNFHREHFDWWTFPIDKGSSHSGFAYDISGEPLERLKQNPKYLSSISRAAELYNRSLGWDLKSSRWIDSPDKSRGQNASQSNINQQRLFKIGRSLQIHGLDNDFNSHRQMVESLRRAGIRVGNESYWDNPNEFVMRSRFKDGDGSISGAMSGIGISPKVMKLQQDDPRRDKEFVELQKARDARNASRDASKGDLTFDWKDDNSRKSFIQRIWKKAWGKGDAKFSEKISSGARWDTQHAHTGLAPQIDENLNLVADLGLHWGVGDKTYSGFFDQYGSVFRHSLSPQNPEGAAGEQVRDLKGYFAPTINPTLYWQRFESWIRNPFSVVRDPNTGRDVGVRKYFNNDRTLLVQEFDRRISKLYDALSEAFGKDIEQHKYIPLPEFANPRPRRDSVPNFMINDIKRQMSEAIEAMSKHSTLEGVRKRLLDFFQTRNQAALAESITPDWLEDYLKSDHKNWLAEQLRRHPDFLRASPLDSLSHDKLKESSEMMELVFDEVTLAGGDPKNIDLSGDLVRTVMTGLSEEQIKKLYEDELRRNRN